MADSPNLQGPEMKKDADGLLIAQSGGGVEACRALGVCPHPTYCGAKNICAAAALSELHQRVMNLPADPKVLAQMEGWDRGFYLVGHRDARHAAAELVAAPTQQTVPTQAPSSYVPTVERLMELVRTLPPRSMRLERNAYLVEIEAIAATLRDGVSDAAPSSEPPIPAAVGRKALEDLMALVDDYASVCNGLGNATGQGRADLVPKLMERKANARASITELTQALTPRAEEGKDHG